MIRAAAFGRLCVETNTPKSMPLADNAAAFGRLCVETQLGEGNKLNIPRQPPSGGCVLKHHKMAGECMAQNAAAFGRLCVETASNVALN